jgi:hypothetical protein
MGDTDIQKIDPNGPNRPEIQKRDHASAGVKVILGFLFICVQTASHLSQLNVIDPPTIRI